MSTALISLAPRNTTVIVQLQTRISELERLTGKQAAELISSPLVKRLFDLAA